MLANSHINTIKTELDTIDRLIIQATQGGLPITQTPYQDIAKQLDIETDVLLQRMQAMQEKGVIRRIGVIPNHYKLGFSANGMSVWNVPEDKITQLGKQIGQLDFVSHCYKRPRFLPEWPYNLFAMVHGFNRDEVMEKVDIIKESLAEHNHGHDVLFSTRLLKKTGLRIQESSGS